jgi:hypothetical protein
MIGEHRGPARRPRKQLDRFGWAASKGGLIGAATETAKKVAETLVTEALDTGPGKWGSGGAKEFNQEYGAQFKNSVYGKTAAKIGLSRLLNDAISKPLKDRLNKKLGTAVIIKEFGSIEEFYRQVGPSAPSIIAGPVSIALTVIRPPIAQQPLDLAALLAGKTAGASGAYQYSTDVSGLAQGTNGLGLEIQAR